MIISLDCETTGLDLQHGAMPFFVSTCNEHGDQEFWDWEVNPYTRKPNVPEEDVVAIARLLDSADIVVGQNWKFDASALDTIRVWDHVSLTRIWPKLRDTLICSHLLASGLPHDLTTLALQYLGINIEPFEQATKVAVTKARSLARTRLEPDITIDMSTGKKVKTPTWRIAQRGLPEMPSAREVVWKNDLWLPKVVAKHLNYEPEHPWWTVLSDYANADSTVTLQLWLKMEKEIRRR